MRNRRLRKWPFEHNGLWEGHGIFSGGSGYSHGTTIGAVLLIIPLIVWWISLILLIGAALVVVVLG